MSDQTSLNLSTAKAGPVECLGQTYASDEVRREHFQKLLAAKLKDPEFRKIEGFPFGTDDAILALSDPPYYTACPNPWLSDFIKHYGTRYEPKKPYHREPFAADVSEGKNHPIYNAHSYHTKVPHRAIMKYILHYTQPGDLVFDGFCGTGMTGVAAQLCGDKAEVRALGYRVLDDGSILDEEGKVFSRIGPRRALLNDLSPAAAFIAYNYNTTVDADAFETTALTLLKRVEKEFGWMYETDVSKSEAKATINYTVWSDVFSCPSCQGDVVFFDEAVSEDGEVSAADFKCPACKAEMAKATATKRMERILNHNGVLVERIRKIPVAINYSGSSGRGEKPFDASDRSILTKIEGLELTENIPTQPLDKNSEQYKRDALHLRGIETAADFYTRRNLIALSRLWKAAHESGNYRRPLLLWLTSIQWLASNMYRYREGGGGGQQGKLTIPSLIREQNVFRLAKDKLRDVSQIFRLNRSKNDRNCVSVGDASVLAGKEIDGIDYVFIDPPFGGNIFYSDLNSIWEGWLGVVTQDKTEAVVHRVQTENAKTLSDYSRLMHDGFSRAFRALKPGRWITVEFSNSQAAVWNSIQTALQQCGFVVANVAALDKQQRSFRSVTSTTAVKQDLVISAYKPNGGLEARFEKHGTTIEGVWDFLRTHLGNLPITKAKGGQLEPIAERDPRILYDRMVAFYIGHSMQVPLSSGEFQAELHTQFPVRDGMVFLPEQVNAYDQKRVQMDSIGQLAIFVEDERSAIDWVRQFIKKRPSTQQDIHPEFMQQLNASWKKWETRPELRALLDQNFLCYDGVGEVPSQIHSYLSSEYKDLRNLDKDHAQLRHRAKDRWYVPDPRKNVDVETLRNRRLLEEFWLYLPEGYISVARNPDKAPTLPGMVVATPRPKVPRSRKLREVRTEAIRVGFKHCYQLKDYATILAVADMLPDSVLNEDEQLQMLYDNAALRSDAST